jgi:hypothetical protein
MARRLFALLLFASCAACATEQRTTVIAQPAVRAIAAPPSDAQLIADSQTACTSYGLLRGTAPFDRCVATEFAARRPG